MLKNTQILHFGLLGQNKHLQLLWKIKKLRRQHEEPNTH